MEVNKLFLIMVSEQVKLWYPTNTKGQRKTWETMVVESSEGGVKKNY